MSKLAPAIALWTIVSSILMGPIPLTMGILGVLLVGACQVQDWPPKRGRDRACPTPTVDVAWSLPVAVAHTGRPAITA